MEKSIWLTALNVDIANRRGKNTLCEHLDIRFIEVGDNYLKATMPVNTTTKQPMGLLNGGASCALAETVGSTAANFCVDQSVLFCVGLDINANHVRAARNGLVTATARPIHLGRKSQVWGIEICNAGGQLICMSRLTMLVMEK